LTFQAAVWAHGLAGRVPSRPEVAASDLALKRRLPDGLDGSVFRPVLGVVERRGAPVLAVASVIVRMCAKPRDVRSWVSGQEWMVTVADAKVDEAARSPPPTVDAPPRYP
jgi:hypothetical protein